jgi:hypothetical protein
MQRVFFSLDNRNKEHFPDMSHGVDQHTEQPDAEVHVDEKNARNAEHKMKLSKKLSKSFIWKTLPPPSATPMLLQVFVSHYKFNLFCLHR